MGLFDGGGLFGGLGGGGLLGDLSGLFGGVGNKSDVESTLGGLNSLMNKQGTNERQGVLCPQKCFISNDKCAECKQRQEVAVAALQSYMELENRVKDLQQNPAQVQDVPTECELCGAPIEKGERECPYCGTKYPAAAAADPIPTGKIEQDEYLLRNAAEAYAKYLEYDKWRIDLQIGGVDKNGGMGVFSKIIGKVGFMEKISDAAKMDGPQIRQGAQRYGVGYGEYLMGITTQTYKPIGQLQMEERLKMMENAAREQRRNMEESHERSMAIERERQNKLRQIRQEGYAREARVANIRSGTYGYSGGADRSCGNCTFYMNGSSHCANHDRSTTASGYCALWKLK